METVLMWFLASVAYALECLPGAFVVLIPLLVVSRIKDPWTRIFLYAGLAAAVVAPGERGHLARFPAIWSIVHGSEAWVGCLGSIGVTWFIIIALAALVRARRGVVRI